MYTKDIRILGPNAQGYLFFCDSTHPLVMCNGLVLLHRHVASLKMGRWLSKEEHVHHIDGNKLNNTQENLSVLSTKEHAHIHRGKREKGICPVCGKMFIKKRPKQCFCSVVCLHHARTREETSIQLSNHKRFIVSADELYRLVWSMPTTKVAKLFNVSDKAIEKRCKILGVEKPPRGYWNKVYADKLNKEDLYGEQCSYKSEAGEHQED